ncbi:MAG: glucose-6-phosphate isomerase [Akkermansia sp.]|nr:glucose-6-phosphate isomerase [Akkermansia sp.]
MCPVMKQYAQQLLRYPDMGISLDLSRLPLTPEFLAEMKPLIDCAYGDIAALESGVIANPDENRMVGHYWLRNSSIAPTPELRAAIEGPLADLKAFAADVLGGKILAPNGQKYSTCLVIGIGGSALGPELVADALPADGLKMAFLDNTDPDGMYKVLDTLPLEETLAVVISKSGGTPETRNGMVCAQSYFASKGVPFAPQAVAVTGVGSTLDKVAVAEGWLKRFPMEDWVGGRTSETSVVGLVPASLQGVDVDSLLKGAADMDARTRVADTATNMSMRLALAWYAAGEGHGKKDMVVLPYKDSLVLFSKYLQQLIMESLGKELDLDGKTVHQGISVYGNKGSTDQHAYVQQLRDGINNFFVTFIEVRQAPTDTVKVEGDFTAGDYLQGFLRGTRKALTESGRQNITISIPTVNAYTLGQLIALFERAVSFYASLIHINAYHQPGVQAGKLAANVFLKLLAAAEAALTTEPATAADIAAKVSADAEDTYHALVHIAESGKASWSIGECPCCDTFAKP